SLTTERPGRGASRDLRRSSMPPHAAPRASRRRWRGIEASPRKEVVLFVHGYANAFQDAAFSMADLCHFFGREFVCAIFTWPAGGTRGIRSEERRVGKEGRARGGGERYEKKREGERRGGGSIRARYGAR